MSVRLGVGRNIRIVSISTRLPNLALLLTCHNSTCIIRAFQFHFFGEVDHAEVCEIPNL